MKMIPLTQGKCAMVDDEDYKRISRHKWSASDFGCTFYAIRNVKGNAPSKHRRSILMHREILGVPDDKETDHCDGNGLNNCKVNLRICSHQQNLYNSSKQTNRSSKYKGVVWYKQTKKWMARVQWNRQRYHLGYFKDETKAALAYNRKAKELFGDFAKLNHIEVDK